MATLVVKLPKHNTEEQDTKSRSIVRNHITRNLLAEYKDDLGYICIQVNDIPVDQVDKIGLGIIHELVDSDIYATVAAFKNTIVESFRLLEN